MSDHDTLATLTKTSQDGEQLIDGNEQPTDRSGINQDGKGKMRVGMLNLMVTFTSPEDLTNCTDFGTSKDACFELIFQLATPIGLMANLASIASVSDRWRMTENGVTVPDLWWVVLLNSLALSCGIFANVVLFLHMNLFLSRITSLIITATLYMAATLFYIALMPSVQFVYFNGNSHGHKRTEGFWHGVIGSCLYFIACLLILVHAWYFKAHKWSSDSSKRQNMLMTFCIIFIFWIGAGAAVFQNHHFLDFAYSEAVYFCVVSCLTLGYGDIVPKNNLSKAIVIPYIMGGLLWGGLVTVNVFQLSVTKAFTKSINASVQWHRTKAQEEFRAAGELTMTKGEDRKSFELMRKIMKTCERRAILARALVSLTWLPIFWLIGAVIFKYTEGWTYFNSFYMCAISLASVGYGDFTVSSTGGRAVFVYWALVALPTLAVVVSNLSSLFQSFEEKKPKFITKIGHIFNNQRQWRRAKEKYNSRLNHLSESLPANPVWKDLVEVIEGTDKEQFDYEIWHEVITTLLKCDKLSSDFWISENSPLRIAGLREKEFLLLTASHVFFENF